MKNNKSMPKRQVLSRRTIQLPIKTGLRAGQCDLDPWYASLLQKDCSSNKTAWACKNLKEHHC